MQRCDPNSISVLSLERSQAKASAFIKVEALGLKRGKRSIFEGLSFEASPGEVLVLSGCSGAGKSSLLSILGKELNATSGSFQISNLKRPSDIGTIYQDLRLSEELSVLDNILSGRLYRLHWWDFFFGFSSKYEEEARSIACDLELLSLLDKPLKFLSGGERQRVAVAKLLFQDPQVILADEPVSSLDPALASKVLNRLKWEAKEKSKIVICALHQRDLSLDFADRIIEFG